MVHGINSRVARQWLLLNGLKTERSPLINISMTNEELELPKEMETVDTEIHFNSSIIYNNFMSKWTSVSLETSSKLIKSNHDVYKILVENSQDPKYGRLPRHL